ncbi:MAG: tetratricopeptide repeat protein [Pseudomonadota bacterium]
MAARIPAAVVSAALMVLAGCEALQTRDYVEELQAPPRLPEPRTTYLDLGRSFLRAGDSDQAKAAFIRSLRVEGMSAQALTGAGIAAEQQGLLSEARRYFERARQMAPDSVMAYNNLGAVLYRMGEYHAAKQAFQAAFALSSGTNRVATHNLALSEIAISRADADAYREIPNPVAIQRQGSGEYQLLTPRAAEKKDES